MTYFNIPRLPAIAALCAFTLLHASGSIAQQAADPRVPEIVKRLGMEESAIPARERKGWRPPKKIVSLGTLTQAQQQAIQAAAPGAKLVMVPDFETLKTAAKDADVILGVTSPGGICEPEVVDPAKQLRWIFATGAGVERCVSIPAVKSRNVLVTNLRAVDSANIAEHAMALTLALARGVDKFVLNQQQARWNRSPAAKIQTLNGKTLLVVGLGGIGTEVARRASGIGMKVVATRNSGRTGPEFVSYVGTPAELLTLAKTADVIVNATPLTPETTGIYDAKFFAALKPTAIFVNMARGGSVVTDALVAALQEGRIAGAGLDVTDPEPLPDGHPLWRAPNVIISPHVSGASDVPSEHRWILIGEQVRRYTAGEKMLSVVDLDRGY